MPEDTMSHMIKDFIVHLGAAGRATSTIACYQRTLNTLKDCAFDSCRYSDKANPYFTERGCIIAKCHDLPG